MSVEDFDVQQLLDMVVNQSSTTENFTLNTEVFQIEGDPDLGAILEKVDAKHEADQKYSKLKEVLNRAFNRAAFGKGKERHSSGETFDRQPIILLNKMLGTNHGALFQALKKILESGRLPQDRAVNELLDVIVYVAASIIITETAK